MYVFVQHVGSLWPIAYKTTDPCVYSNGAVGGGLPVKSPINRPVFHHYEEIPLMRGICT